MKNKDIYKKEISRLKKHRGTYRPCLLKIYHDYIKLSPGESAEISDPDQIRLVVELIDLGYLDNSSVIIRKEFGDISGVVLTSRYPFTAAGVGLAGITEEGEFKKLSENKSKKLLSLLLFVAVLLIVFFIIYVKWIS